ncbi:MAG: hypothetical protein J0I33_00135 [Microbacterium ginsengisoli]|uniref:hypothetical protein n=1 Tax=Microbacterium TaxID=33882 RepID=UPI0006FBA4ED|nr:hypothetical protein [Microbacterium sp. Leaf351]KQR91285.1 hypothetical protein ASF93_08030 [Microbacterium sp. Leaf347]KQS01273.1 hypothetical protein ASG00_10860 [Microbacterium sp. Leaf351]MBN9197041.1 hypothetical protein [Microbacterium ginsengisoli]OJU76999.1 MAG: hypothetical protein BGO15_05705 [Microbacterium sp. 71-23]
MERQIAKRILTISHAQFWPGITPTNVGDLEYGTWLALAQSCDKQVQETKRARDEREPARSSRRR